MSNMLSRTGGHTASLRETLELAVVVMILMIVALCADVPSARAVDRPILQVASEGVPTNLLPGGTGEYLLHVSNIGAAPTNGSITVVDRLPPGMTAMASGGRRFEGEPLGGTYWECSGATVVTCRNNPAGLPTIGEESGALQLIVIDVKAPVPEGGMGSVTNVVSVSGGGSAEATSSERTTIGSSPAGFGLRSFQQLIVNRDGSLDTQAGSHPYSLVTNFVLNNDGHFGAEVPAAGEIKDLEVSLPAGFAGNPNATPKCPRALFDRGRKEKQEPECPANTRVGTVLLTLSEPYFVLEFPVYNLAPPAGVPAQFGFAYQYRVGFIDFGVRTGEGYALKAVLRSVDQLRVLRASLTVWGLPAEHGTGVESTTPLLTNPTSCDTPLTNTVSMDSWEEPLEALAPFSHPVTGLFPLTDGAGHQLQTTGCGRLDFSPEVEVRPTSTVASTPTGVDVELKLPQSERPGGLAEAHLRDAVVTLPPGMVVSPSVANGLQACTLAQIGLTNGNEPTCADASRIGEVTAHTPLLEQPLRGSVYVAKQEENPFSSLLAIYLTAEADGALVKLAGHVQADPTTGQLTTTFDENPQLPFSDLKVRLFSGPRAALVTPAACGSYVPSTQLTGWNGAVAVPRIEGFSLSTGCSHGFSPSFTAGMKNNSAGGFAPFSTTISRPDGDQMLGAVSVTTPPGLLGMLSQIPLCGEPQAGLGTCPQVSLIGHTTAVAGPGPDPVTVGGGQVFLTGPYRGGPFGLSIVVPAVAGPFNLGNVMVRAAIYVDPHTARITILSDPLPTIEQGIPLQIRAIDVSVDRHGFTFNPTNCAPLAVDGTIASNEGASVAVSSRFQAADCASLPFKPKFTVSTRGSTSRAQGAGLHVKVASTAGQANIAKVEVKLPKQLPARLTTLRQACVAATFDANPATCPAGSRVGIAKGITPVLPVPLAGPAYLVSHGGEAFPDLIVILQGDGVRIDLTGNTFISHGITSSTFGAVPDAPISSFELNLPQGPNSALATNLPAKLHGNLCATTLLVPTVITAQNGAQVKQSTRIALTGCPKRKPKRGKARKRAR